jgi:hypothetical protein
MESSFQSRNQSYNETKFFRIDSKRVQDAFLDIFFKLDFNQRNFESNKEYQWELYVLPFEQEVFESTRYTFEDNFTIDIETYSLSGLITGNLTLNDETYVFSHDSYTYKEIKPQFIFLMFSPRKHK